MGMLFNGVGNSGNPAFGGFVHDGSSSQIRLKSLKRLLPEGKTTDAGDVIKTFFEEVKPGRGNYYRDCPKISKFLQETTLEQIQQIEGKRLRFDYRGSSEVFWKDGIYGNSLAKTWFWHGSMKCSDATQVEAIFRSELVANRQASSLGSAMSESVNETVNETVISFACSGSAPQATGHDTNVPGAVDVDLLVHSSKKNIRLVCCNHGSTQLSSPKL